MEISRAGVDLVCRQWANPVVKANYVQSELWNAVARPLVNNVYISRIKAPRQHVDNWQWWVMSYRIIYEQELNEKIHIFQYFHLLFTILDGPKINGFPSIE